MNTNLKKLQSQLTNMIADDIETFNTDRAAPYANCINWLSKISGNNNRVITEREYEKCRKDCIVFKGLDNSNEMLDYVLQLKGERRTLKNQKKLKIIYTHLLIKEVVSIQKSFQIIYLNGEQLLAWLKTEQVLYLLFFSTVMWILLKTFLPIFILDVVYYKLKVP